MTKKKKLKKISQLKSGDIVKNKGSAYGYVITANYGNYAIGVRTIHISNPNEWEIVE